MNNQYSFCERRYFSIQTCSSKKMLGFCLEAKNISEKAAKVIRALEEKHDSKEYAQRLVNDIQTDFAVLAEMESCCNTIKVQLLNRIDQDEYERHATELAVKYVPQEYNREFINNNTVRSAIDYLYNSMEIKVLNRMSRKRLDEINDSLTEEIEPLKQYHEIKTEVDCLQTIVHKLHKIKVKTLSKLNKDIENWAKNRRISRCIVFKHFRKAVWKIKRNINSAHATPARSLPDKGGRMTLLLRRST